METNAIFRKNYGSFRRFFSMLGKADLPVQRLLMRPETELRIRERT